MKSTVLVATMLAALQNALGGQASALSPRNLQPRAAVYANGGGSTAHGGCSGNQINLFVPGAGTPECVSNSGFSCIQALGSSGDLTCTTLMVEAYWDSNCQQSAGTVGWDNFGLSGNEASVGTNGNNFHSFRARACSTGNSPCQGNACGFDSFPGCPNIDKIC